jgi:hypothetical protein
MSVQWKPPGMTWTGAFGVETKGPPGRNSEDTPAVRHGSSSPLVQVRRVVSLGRQPPVRRLTATVVARNEGPCRPFEPSGPAAGGKKSAHWRCQ